MCAQQASDCLLENSLPGRQQQLVFNPRYFQPFLYFKRHSGNLLHVDSRLPKHVIYKFQSLVFLKIPPNLLKIFQLTFLTFRKSQNDLEIHVWKVERRGKKITTPQRPCFNQSNSCFHIRPKWYNRGTQHNRRILPGTFLCMGYVCMVFVSAQIIQGC